MRQGINHGKALQQADVQIQSQPENQKIPEFAENFDPCWNQRQNVSKIRGNKNQSMRQMHQGIGQNKEISH